MKKSVIGWESVTPIQNEHTFTQYLVVKNGRLYLDGFDLTSLVEQNFKNQNKLNTPLEIVYLPIIRQKIQYLNQVFQKAIDELNYAGKFFYTYASKANAAEEVIRTILSTGVHHEISSWIDIEIVYHMMGHGFFSDDKWIVCNGFKPSGSQYAQKIIQLQQDHKNIIPVIEDFAEISGLIDSQVSFDVGLRLKSYGKHDDLPAQDKANSRFGLDSKSILVAAEQIQQASNLKLKLLHAMVGSQLIDEKEFVDRLSFSIELYAKMKQDHPSLEIFDFGGGIPVQMTVNFEFDYGRFAELLLSTVQRICLGYNVPVPHIMGEMGRYTVAEHGAHIFRVLTVKENLSDLPWYIIDGSVMSSFPDSWALGEHFIVLPLNHFDKPFQKVRLGGITCDGDDIYPPKSSEASLYLPKTSEDLYIGFFNIGAYQEMLGGVGGSKHCVIPEADELIIDRDHTGEYFFEKISGQSAEKILKNLGYKF